MSGKIAIVNLGDNTHDVFTAHVFEKITSTHNEPVVLQPGTVHFINTDSVTIRIDAHEKRDEGEEIGTPFLLVSETDPREGIPSMEEIEHLKNTAVELGKSKTQIETLQKSLKERDAEVKKSLTAMNKAETALSKANAKIEKLTSKGDK